MATHPNIACTTVRTYVYCILTESAFDILFAFSMASLTQGRVDLCLAAVFPLVFVLAFCPWTVANVLSAAPPSAITVGLPEHGHESNVYAATNEDVSGHEHSVQSDSASSDTSSASESSTTSPPPEYDWLDDPNNLQRTSPKLYYEQLCAANDTSISTTAPVSRTGADCFCWVSSKPSVAGAPCRTNTPKLSATPRVSHVHAQGYIEDHTLDFDSHYDVAKTHDLASRQLPDLNDPRTLQYALFIRRPDILQAVATHWQRQIAHERILADLRRPFELAELASATQREQGLRLRLQERQRNRELEEWLEGLARREEEWRRAEAEARVPDDGWGLRHVDVEMGEVGSELRSMQDVEMSNDNSVIPDFGAQPQSALFGHAPAMVVPQLLLNDQPLDLPTLPSAATQHQSAFAPPRVVAQPAPIASRPLRPEATPFVPGQQTHSVHASPVLAHEGLLDSLNLAVDSGPGSGPARDLNTFPGVSESAVKVSAARRRARLVEGQSASIGEEAGPGKARGRKVSRYRSRLYDYDGPRDPRRSRFHDRSPTPELIPDRKPLPPIEPARQLSAAEIEANKEAALDLQRQKGHEQRYAEAKALQERRMVRWEEMRKKGTESQAKAIMDSNVGMWQMFWEQEKKLAKEEGWELPDHPSQATREDDSDSEEDDEEDWEEVQVVIQDPDGRVTAQ